MSLLDGITRQCKAKATVNPPPKPAAAITVKGRVRVEVVGPDGRTKARTGWQDNILTTYGLASLASMVGSSAAVTASNWIQAIYIGTASTAPSSNGTGLNGSTASLPITSANFTKTNTAARIVEYRASFLSNNTSGAWPVMEVALFCNSTGNQAQNHMAAHAILSTTMTKAASDTVRVSYQLVLGTAA